MLTFYVKVLREVFFIYQEMALVGGIRAQLGTFSCWRMEVDSNQSDIASETEDLSAWNESSKHTIV